MYQVILDIHVAAALFGFVWSGGLAVAAWRSRSANVLSGRWWRAQVVVQVNTLILAACGVALWLEGGRPRDPLHILYGALALLTILFQRALGPDGTLLDAVWAKPPEDVPDRRLVWMAFGLNAFLWAMYGRGLTTGFFGF